jgi:hypothetical protein
MMQQRIVKKLQEFFPAYRRKGMYIRVVCTWRGNAFSIRNIYKNLGIRK